MTRSGSAERRDLFDELAELRARRATGVLEIEAGGQKRRLYLRDGELLLPGAHPLARLLSEQRERFDGGGEQRETARSALLELVDRITTVFSDWRGEPRAFHPGVGDLPVDLVGPVPTARLLLAGATSDLDGERLEKRFGNSRVRYLTARDAERRIDALGFSPEEAFVIERLRVPLSVGELEQQSPVPRPGLLRALAGLIRLGAVRSEDDAGPAPGSGEHEVAARLAERIGHGLAEEPLELEADEYRERITDLLARHGGLDHYELLGLSPGAPTEEIQAGFEATGRLVHPLNARRFGWSGREDALKLLFERAARAYETLIDPERRRVYHEREGIRVPGETPSGERREREVRELSREQYERALAYSRAGDVHNAIQLLEQIVERDPRVEYWTTLARLQSRNPAWRDRALESFRRALQIDAADANVRFGMGELYEEMGETERARAQFAAAVRADPDHFEATERLSRLDSARKSRGEGSGTVGGFLSRLFRRR